MARMTREFSLVLLGAGMLTAGSFLWPEDDLKDRADKEADRQVASSSNTGRTGYRPLIFFYGGGFAGGGSSGASPARVSFTRGGFGGTGASVSGLS